MLYTLAFIAKRVVGRVGLVFGAEHVHPVENGRVSSGELPPTAANRGSAIIFPLTQQKGISVEKVTLNTFLVRSRNGSE